MEYKSLKIDSDLHEKLKELADDKHTSMQNLIENKLTELIEHEEDILFTIDKVKYDNQIKKYSLEMDEQSFNKLINFFEIFLTNRNIKNIKEIENLLKMISKLKSHDATKLNTIKENLKNDSLKDFASETELKKNLNNIIEENSEHKEFSFSDFENGCNNSLRQILTTLDSVRFSMAKEDLSSTYVNLNGYGFLDNINTEISNREKTEFFEILEISMRNKLTRQNYLKQGDIIKDPKTNYDYVIDKVYNNVSLFQEPSYVLKGMSALTMDTEILYTKDDLINHNFLIGEKLLLEIIDEIDFKYEKLIQKLVNIKDVAYDLKSELNNYKIKNITLATLPLNEIDENITLLETSINEELDYEQMKSKWIKTKVWFEELKIRA